ncbi:MAG: phosphoglycerate dehydrogenase [Lachnospiraceae bacterium]|nr:phosphoglycerate dehydrogenase [Lachnospiraceae bacterium]
MYKYATLNPIAQVGLDVLTDEYVKTEDVNEAQAILVRSASMHDMELSANLECVARAGAGVNNIPLDKCAEQGVVVFNTPGANANGVKELVMAGMLLACRDIYGGMQWVEENKTDADINKTMEKAKKNFAGSEVKGKKLGVIGLGAIGVLVANMANRMGMQVFGVDPYLSVVNAVTLNRDVTILKSYDELYKTCDFITIHVPLLESTKGMLNKDAFDKMKEGTVVLNFSRDTLVNDDDMGEALKSGKVAKYVTDFPNAKVLTFPNVIATPHLGASTEESEDNCAMMAAEEIRAFLEDGNIINSVNMPNCDAGKCDSAARITIIHKNKPNMIAQFTQLFAKDNVNIAHLTDKSRGDYAYSVIDIDAVSTQKVVDELTAIDGVVKVRVIK